MNLILIGYILVLFHFRINGFDLLPDFVGYILIFSGLGRLVEESPLFAKARPWALVLTVLEVFFLVAGLFGGFSSVIIVVNIVFTCIYLYLIYLIGHGIYDMEQKKGINLGGKDYVTLWKFQAGFTLSMSLLSLFLSNLTAVLAWVLGICALIANIVFLVYLFRTKKALEE